MMKETLIYSLQATALGMAVVFSFLFMLQMVIILIKGCLEQRTGKVKKEDRHVKPVHPGGVGESKGGSAASGVEDWLPLAVGIFLLEEEADGQVCAASWAPFNDEKTRMWILSK